MIVRQAYWHGGTEDGREMANGTDRRTRARWALLGGGVATLLGARLVRARRRKRRVDDAGAPTYRDGLPPVADPEVDSPAQALAKVTGDEYGNI